MKNYLFPFFTSVILVLSGVINAQGNQEESKNNLFVIDDQTTISFSIPEDRYFYSNSVDENTNLLDLRDITFSMLKNISSFKAYEFYIQRIRLENITKEVKNISVISGLNHMKSQFFLISKGSYESFLNDPGGFNSNFLSSINPKKTESQNIRLRNFTFQIKPGESVDLYYKFQMPNKTHFYANSLQFYHAEQFQENRRFGIWLEGIIVGSILGLLIFTLYSYSQIRDKTTLYFGLWLITAIGAVIGQTTHDGARFFEFLIPPVVDNPFFNTHSFPTTVAGLTGYTQAMMFVIFARQFISLKEHYPIAFQFTNLYLVWYAAHFFIVRLYDINVDLRLIWYPLILSTLIILVLIYYYSIKRYRNGMLLAKFFIIGLLPYLVFRIFGLLGIVGIKQPFAYLPESGLEFFLNQNGVTQSVGLFTVAVIMSLVLAKRTKFLQDELNENIQKQVDEAEKQKVVLEETVLERTSELREKSTMMEGISNQLAKYIPPQIHEALFAGKVDTKITTRRRKLTVFFSDIKNFTSTSENMQPEDLTKYLNEYFSEMTKIAVKYGATIDKYIGDSMMVFFGDPESRGEKEDARICIEMALEMQERMKELREKWAQEGFAEPFEIRMGVNTGYCNVGNFGSDQRLTYTIIGGEVNVAARLESVAEVNGLYMSYETYAHVQDMVEVEQKEAIKMKGINRDIRIYSVRGRKEEGKEQTKVTKVTKPTKKELTEIEQLKEELSLIKLEIRKLKR